MSCPEGDCLEGAPPHKKIIGTYRNADYRLFDTGTKL
ncbi:MAG: hypothetical protein UW79_C0036G0008 [Candidatus Yanofskybacteria bacterium GW2011_GWA2_44_9]|uniref:Uncharacterized protein n=1 Tax=Candidatus Yanofskybacteria bacterium GW2011_GWA2_44_9 TaxID=1619025 RepID=A0A0G1KAX1_9BACT|nr:MAG: hypothetical protein UW79_C0036G0008 [Candidatus Yanofskybacteria bacterium GW2011_GWA2_44_9]